MDMGEAIKAIRSQGGECLNVETLALLARMEAANERIASDIAYLRALQSGAVVVRRTHRRQNVRPYDRTASIGRSKAIGAQ